MEDRVRYGGLDLSSTTDITAFVLVFPPEDMEDPDDKYIVLPYFWVPEETLDLRVRRDHVPYTDDTVYNGWYKSVYQSPVPDLHNLQKSVDQEDPARFLRSLRSIIIFIFLPSDTLTAQGYLSGLISDLEMWSILML